MRRYLFITASMFVFFVMLFFLVEALGVPLLADPTPWMKQAGVVAASIGVSLLIADVLLPVPSSLVMVAHGALFGVVTGTFLSLLGSVGAALLGFAIGRRGGPLLNRILTPDERVRADRMLARWGTLAVIVTRPIPLLAETVAIMAGASLLGWGRMALAALFGSLAPALLYALTGAAVANFQSTSLIFGIVVVATGSCWLVGRLLDRYLSKRRDRREPDGNRDLNLAQE